MRRFSRLRRCVVTFIRPSAVVPSCVPEEVTERCAPASSRTNGERSSRPSRITHKSGWSIYPRWNDATPLNNPGQTSADYGFAGDSLQLRTLTAPGTPEERGQHFTAWRGHDGADVIKIEQGKDFKDAEIIRFQKTDDTAIRSAAAWYDQNVYLAWDVRDKTPWVNGAEQPENLSLRGDPGLDLFHPDAGNPRKALEFFCPKSRIAVD